MARTPHFPAHSPAPPLSAAPLRAAASLRAEAGRARLQQAFGTMLRGTLTGALAGVLVLTGGLGLTGGLAGAALAERLALVVGNGDYAALPPIGTAPRDAADLARALERLDFKVTLLTDATGLGLVGALRDLIGQADQGGADTLLFYYAGHGFQLDGTNYLAPVDATLAGRGRIAAETLPLDGVLARLQGRNRQVILLLDASAAAVLPPEISGAVGGADAPVGLAPITPGNGTFVAFSAQPDTLGVTAGAAEGAAPHSPFAAALLDKIEEKGVSVSDTMIRVRSAVEKATERRQTPWDRSSLRAQFYFNPVYETSSGLTAADYEMLAGMAPERRAQFLKLLDNTGISFKIQNIEEAKADIVAAGQLTITAAPEAGQVAPADTGPASPSFQILAEAPPEAAPETAPETPAEAVADVPAETLAEAVPETRPEVVAEAAPAPAAPGPVASVTPPMITAPSVTAPTGPDVIALATPDLPARPGQAGSPRMIAPEPAQTAPVADTTPDQAPALDDTVTASIPPATTPAATVVATAPSDTAPGPEAAPEPAPEPAPEVAAPAPEPAEPEAPALMLALADPRAPVPGDAATATDAPAMTDAVADLVIPADLASAVQTELSRVGCYRARVDGAWGRQSSLAAIRYYSERDVTPDTLEPTEALYRLLVAEDSVVCKNTVAVARAVVRPEATAPAPVVRQTPRRVIEAPAQNETKRRTIGGGITGVFR
jgi:hypothetical protein